MPDNQAEQDNNFKKQLEGIVWPLDYGIIKIQIRAGKLTLITIERTIKLD